MLPRRLRHTSPTLSLQRPMLSFQDFDGSERARFREHHPRLRRIGVEPARKHADARNFERAEVERLDRELVLAIGP